MHQDRGNVMDPIQSLLPVPSPLLIVISGPLGVGKDSVVKRMADLGYPFHFVVTATSRPPRPGEAPGIDYHFYSEADFREMLARGEFLEHAIVYGEYKGIPKSQVREALASGKDVVMRLDVQGAATIRKIAPEALLIFISTATEDELIQRLKARRTETPEALRKRILTVKEEMKCLSEFDYVVINRDHQLDATVEQIGAIIKAERCRVQPRRVKL
jgi:guanylate kinase